MNLESESKSPLSREKNLNVLSLYDPEPVDNFEQFRISVKEIFKGRQELMRSKTNANKQPSLDMLNRSEPEQKMPVGSHLSGNLIVNPQTRHRSERLQPIEPRVDVKMKHTNCSQQLEPVRDLLEKRPHEEFLGLPERRNLPQALIFPAQRSRSFILG